MTSRCICIVLSFSPLFVFANSEVDILELSLQELAQVTIAAKQKQTVYSSPSSVSVINRTQIKNMGIKTLQALLNFVPGFQSTRDIEQGTANRISARGRSTALSESVLILIDGEKINDLYTGGISILNRLFDLGHVERVEIIRGPGSALYGGNAFLGVINIVTTTNLNEVAVALDSTAETSVSANVSKMFNNGYVFDGYFSAFSGRGDDFYITDNYGVSDSVKDPAKGYDFYSKLLVDNWLFNARYMQRTLTDFIALGSIGNDINKEETQQWSVSAKYSGELSEKFHYKLSASHNEDKWNTLTLLIPNNTEMAPGFFLDGDFIGGPFLTSDRNHLSLDTVYQLNNNQKLSVGISYEEASITDVHTSTSHDLFTLSPYEKIIELTGEDSFNDKKRREISSVYLQDQFKLNAEWELTAGFRLDHYNDFGRSINPRLALIWNPQPRNSFKIMYGTAFRAPNFLELYDRNNYIDFGNVTLNAEEVATTELSWLSHFSTWDIEITAFHNSFTQLITLGPPVTNENNPFFSPTFMNNQNKESFGTEIIVEKKITDNFNVKLLWNWFSASSDINTARNTGALIADYQWNKFNINLSSYFRGYNPVIINQGSYFVTDANIVYNVSSNLDINLSMSNMFNQRYNTQSVIYPEGIPNRGAVYRVNLTYRFL